MPRPLRPIDDGLIYHVINRGNNRQDVFYKHGDFEAFVKAMADLKERKPFELYGYCLMSNHFHLLVRPRGAPISRIMQSLLVSHTQRYHKNHRSGGQVWQGRFKSPVIQNDEHLLTVLRYIEANPLRGVQLLAKGTNRDDGGAELVYYETSGGGEVFSAGSIAWPSCLLVDDAVSKITANVLRRFLQ